MNPRLKRTLGLLKWMPDRQYLKLYYFFKFKRPLDLENPKSYNEQLQWLKLYDRKPEYTKLVDKYEVKTYVAEKIGEEYIIPTLGVWDNVEEIDFDTLPNRFVLKCTHDSGGIVICKDKTHLNIDETKKALNAALKSDFYYIGREWPYKNVKPRILAEAYMEDSVTEELRDYKFFCFNGQAKMMFITTNRQKGKEALKVDFYDMDFHHLPFERGYARSHKTIDRPETFDQMRALSEKLSQGIPHVRVDFYEVDGKNYFGEMTFFPGNGTERFEPDEWDYNVGRWLTLPDKTEERK